METIKERIDRINKAANQSTKSFSLSQISYNKVAIKSELYQNELIISPDETTNFLTPEYLNEESDILNHDFYIKFDCENPDVISKFLPMIPASIPVLIINPQQYYPNPNIVYSFSFSLYMNDILQEIIKNNKLYFSSKRAANLVIELSDLTTINLSNLKKLQQELEKYPNINYSFRINVYDKNTLLNLEKLKDITEDKEVVVKLADYLFSIEEKHPNSARSILRNNGNVLKNIEDRNWQYLYLNQRFNALNEVVKFEKEIDVLLTRIPKNASFVEKITFITMFIINYFEYDYQDKGKIRNFHELFQDKKGVCRDFAELIKVLCERLKIDCETLKLFNQEGYDGHAFNVVSFENKKYFLDVTWALEEIQKGMLKSITESGNFLADNKHFGHGEYFHSVGYRCETYPRKEIALAIKKVKTWKNNYFISINNLKDLLRKLDTTKKLENEQEILAALPGNGGRK